ncbi:MAG: glycosyltransferase family 4 protein [Candidatus Bathycorpusculaceae bacterium]
MLVIFHRHAVEGFWNLIKVAHEYVAESGVKGYSDWKFVVHDAKKRKSYKICVIYPGPLPMPGGAETLSYELAISLANKNRVFVVCLPSQLLGFGHKNLRILPILRKRKIGFVRNFFVILKLLIKERFDVIHAHFAFPAATWGVVGKLFRIPVIVTSHGGDIQKDEAIGYGTRLNKIAAIIMWVTLKLVNIHVILNKSMMKDAVESGSSPSKIRVVHNGINLKKILLMREADILRKYGLNKNHLILLYLGRLHPKKCPDDLIKAFPKAVQRVPNLRLVFAGKGEEREKLEKLASNLNIIDKVIFTGFVSEDEKWGLLRNCDIFVLPSILEAFGVTVLEAMACSKPVIATNLGPFPEIIRDGETGLLVPPHVPDELADAIIKLAVDDVRRRKMGVMARKDVEERFDIDKIAEDYLKLYEQLIKKGK